MSNDLPAEEDEELRVYRVGRFEQLGFGYQVALELALAQVDWHAADRMLLSGADHDVVARILLP